MNLIYMNFTLQSLLSIQCHHLTLTCIGLQSSLSFFLYFSFLQPIVCFFLSFVPKYLNKFSLDMIIFIVCDRPPLPLALLVPPIQLAPTDAYLLPPQLSRHLLLYSIPWLQPIVCFFLSFVPKYLNKFSLDMIIFIVCDRPPLPLALLVPPIQLAPTDAYLLPPQLSRHLLLSSIPGLISYIS